MNHKSRYDYQRAKAQFLTIRAHAPGDERPEDHLLGLQLDLYRWQVNHFGLPQALALSAGMVEEMGELDAAGDKVMDQIDAIGDVGIYGAQLLTFHNLSLSAAVDDAVKACRRDKPAIQIAGLLSRVTLKGTQKIRGLSGREEWRKASYDAIVDTLAWAARRTENLGADIEFVARTEVLKRTRGHVAIPE